jgi:surface antigen
MKRHSISTLIAALLLGMASLPAFSAATTGTWSFLKGTPAELFSEEDWTLFKDAVKGVLETGEVGASQAWASQKSTAKGEVEVVKLTKDGGKDCKKLKITNQAKDRKRISSPVFCKQPDGQWKLSGGKKSK